MKPQKQLGSFSLSDSLEIQSKNSCLQRIIGDSTKKIISNPIKKFIPLDSVSLEDLAQCFDADMNTQDTEAPFDDLMDSFISKHGSSTFNTLDELLAASLIQNTYEPKSIQSLSDILDGLIEDLE